MDIRTALRNAINTTGRGVLRGRSVLDTSAAPRLETHAPEPGTGGGQTGDAGPILLDDNRPLMDAPEGIKIRRWIPSFIEKIRLRIARIRRHIWPELTPLERAEKEEQEQRNKQDIALRKQAVDAMAIMSNTLARMGYCYARETEGRRVIKEVVKFDWCRYSPLVIQCHVDADRLPWRVSITDLLTNDVCTNLSASLRVPVRAEVKYIKGLITGLVYSVELGGSMGIPDIIRFADTFPLIAKEAPALSVPLGVSENKRPQVRNLADLPHLLIAGQTLGGKSNMLNVILCTIILRNAPAAVRFAMIDLKGGGIELGHYEGIGHLLQDIPGVPGGIARDSDTAVMVLQYIADESSKRQRAYTQARVKNISEWNRKHKTRRHARIILVIDELALLLDRDDPKIRRETLRLIKEIAATARAAGIHIIAATQSPDKSVINNTVKVNIPGRIAFSVPDVPGSILIINTGEAVNLNPAGRAVWKHGTDKVLVQTPLISNADIARAVIQARGGEQTQQPSGGDIGPLDLIRWALSTNNARLDFRSLFNQFSGQIEKDGLNQLLLAMDNLTFDLDDMEYRVIPGAGNRPRRLVLVED